VNEPIYGHAGYATVPSKFPDGSTSMVVRNESQAYMINKTGNMVMYAHHVSICENQP
jgi:hypothetical protein